MTTLLTMMLFKKFQNEVIIPSGYANGGTQTRKDKSSQKIRRGFPGSTYAYPCSYWTRETTLELLEGFGHDRSETEEYFGDLSEEELVGYLTLVPEEYQPRGASTPQDELLAYPYQKKDYKQSAGKTNLGAQKLKKYLETIIATVYYSIWLENITVFG